MYHPVHYHIKPHMMMVIIIIIVADYYQMFSGVEMNMFDHALLLPLLFVVFIYLVLLDVLMSDML